MIFKIGVRIGVLLLPVMGYLATVRFTCIIDADWLVFGWK